MTPARDVPIFLSAFLPTLPDFNPGTIRGAPGFFRVGQTFADAWWLIDADDRAFFSCGINAIGRGAGPAFDDTLSNETAAPAEVSSDAGAVQLLRENLRAWRVNTIGPGSVPEIENHAWAYTENLGLTQVEPQIAIRLGGAFLPDVFDPKWSEACERQAAERCALRRSDGRLIGYFTDDNLNWAQLAETGELSRPVRPSLLQICLSLEPGFAAYHAAWELTLAAHGGDWSALVRAWDVPLPNKETLRQLTLADVPLTSVGYRRDLELFSREFARRYFAVSAQAIRGHDPHHLLLGCRFQGFPSAAILGEAVFPFVDVVSLSVHEPAFFERIDTAAKVQGMPIFLAEFSWTNEAFTSAAGTNGGPILTRIERMLARGRAQLERAFAHPALVGCAWARWADSVEDRPPFGRGLVHVDGREALEHTELLSDLYTRAARLRLAAATSDQP